MNATFRTARLSTPLRPARRCAVNRSVAIKANNSGFDIDKFVAELPVPVEYAYAGVAWGAPRISCFWRAVHEFSDGLLAS
jgi:hypothetical protein